MLHEVTSGAVASILSNLAKQHAPQEEKSFSGSAIANGLEINKISLPGEGTVEKQTLERELTALAARIQYLETRATGTASLPVTPNEPHPHSFPHAEVPASPRQLANPPKRSISWVNSLLARNDGEPSRTRELTEEQGASIREHIDQQAEEIREQKSMLENVRSQLAEQQDATKHALDTLGTSPSIDQLKREIEKNAQINTTYQKVLKEIGTIITAVAKGDLSKKVLIHSHEKDPEIKTFKETINTMVDQLSEFGSQVTHIAKEVGTEGRLGGRADVPGVDGIWKELTENGM